MGPGRAGPTYFRTQPKVVSARLQSAPAALVMLNALRLLLVVSSAAAFSISPVLSSAGGRPTVQPRMGLESLGYQTEAAGSARLVQEMGLADDISLLRAAVSRCSTEKDLDAQRTLLLQCQKVQHRLKANMKVLREQVHPLPYLSSPHGSPALAKSLFGLLNVSPFALPQEAEMQALLRPVDGMLRQGGRIYGSDFDAQLAELDRELK